MLIMLFSDSNFVQQGFDAEFFVFSCPQNCNNRGSCANSLDVCDCDKMYTGKYCERETCLSNLCNGEGNCVLQEDIYHCHCNQGYSGDDCSFQSSLNGSTLTSSLQWNYVSIAQFGQRTGHNMVYVEEVNKLFIFNGHDLNNVSSDLIEFDILSNKWTTKNDGNPYPRYNAGADDVPFGFACYGGWVSYKNLTVSNKLIVYNAILSLWSQPNPKCQNLRCSNPPGLVYHTLTSIDDSILYIVGGVTKFFDVNEVIYKYDILQNVWTEVMPRNYIGIDIFRFGHSTVYDKRTNSLLVYGGFVPQTMRLSIIDDNILMFDLHRALWIKIKQSSNYVWPTGRAFHSASIHNDYMIVFGGTTGNRVWTENENCITNSVWLNKAGTQNWKSLNLSQSGCQNFLSRFGHVNAMIGENLLISGGYNGRVLDDVCFFKLPATEFEYNVLQD